MSWNGAIPRGKFKVKGLRNKRSQKSFKALLAKQIQADKRAAARAESFERH